MRLTFAGSAGTAAIALAATACDGVQSALTPAGRGAEQIAELFWWMVGGAAAVWLIVVGLAVYAIAVRPREHSERSSRILIIGGGVIFPTVVLTILLAYGLSLLPPLLEPAPPNSLRIRVSGEQWWWRVRYEPPGLPSFETANLIHLPVGEPVEFLLESPDVIHSFWIPSLGGKMDMIPGRKTRLTLHPTRTGTFRGVCAEFCGDSHSMMNFDVVVQDRPAFDAWLASQSAPARAPATASAGHDIFMRSGCAACHTIRGTEADGIVGPDLTHVGSRPTIGASVLPTRPESLIRFIEATSTVKPGVHMPSFDMLSESELDSLATYLLELR